MRLAAASTAIMLAGCGAVEPPVKTVAEILGQCDAYLGKPVRVLGYIDACAGYECHLYPDLAAVQRLAKANKEVQAEHNKVIRGAKVEDTGFDEAYDRVNAVPEIGVGGGREFDLKAAPFQYQYVVISGRMDEKSCTGKGGLHRVTGIHPTDIRAWNPSEGAPANTH